MVCERPVTWSAGALGALLTLTSFTGCIVQSLHPIHDPAASVAEPGLIGTWIPVDAQGKADPDRGLWRFDKDALLLTGDHEPLKVSWSCFRVGEQSFMECWLHDEELESHVDLWPGLYIPTHALCKVVLDGDRLSLRGLDLGWAEKATDEDGRQLIRHEVVAFGKNENVPVFTASTAEWQDFLAAHGGDDEAFPADNALEFLRLRVMPPEGGK